jgi:hypothetical protein
VHLAGERLGDRRVSSWVTPTSTRSPSVIAPMTSSSTVTLARLTVWIRARTQ